MAVETLSVIDVSGAQGQQFMAGDLKDGKTVDADDFVPVAEVQGDKSNAYGGGAGPQDERTNLDGWSDFDLQLLDGSGANVAAAGKFRFEIYGDPQQEDFIAKSRTFPATHLRAAVSNGLRDKVLIAAMLEHMAGDDGYLVLAYKATSSETGYDVDAAASATETGIAYSEL